MLDYGLDQSGNIAGKRPDEFQLLVVAKLGTHFLDQGIS